jgi:RNA polymerase primary sigma factor
MGKIYVSTGAVVTDTPSVKKYMNEIKKAPLLDRDTETALATKALAGDTKAQKRLVECNLRFAVQVAKQYQGMGLELEDLIGFANLGLFEAAKRFDPTRGVKFISFAVWYVRAELQKCLNDKSRVVRIPSHKTMTEGKDFSTLSTSSKVGDDEDSETYADRYLSGEQAKPKHEVTDLKELLNVALNNLKPKQRAAVKMFYGIDRDYAMHMEHIAEELNVTGERARQLIRQGEKALQGVEGIDKLMQYL